MMVDPLSDVPLDVEVEVTGPDARVHKPMGLGKPLTIEITSLYAGDAHGALLVTSAVKDPLLDKAGVAAIHYIFDHVDSWQFVEPSAFDRGSAVVYYSPKLTDTRLQVSMRLAFDRFNKDLYDQWAKTASDALSLPAFLGGALAAGPAGAAAGQALARVVGEGVKLGVVIADNLIDGSVEKPFNWDITIGGSGGEPGYHLLTAADKAGDLYISNGQSVRIDGKNYKVNDDGVLVYATNGAPVKEWWPYAVVYIDGSRYSQLKRWRPAAVSAALAQQFLSSTKGEDIADGLGKALEAYSDLQLVNRVNELDVEIGDAEGDDLVELQARRSAVYGNILNAEIKKLVAPPDSGTSEAPSDEDSKTADPAVD